jgi:pyruvate,water dikinase
MPRVAVRSSAIDEDGALASFAGQHETYLNLSGPEEIADAVIRCWETSRSDRAFAYRREFGLQVETVQLAVLVQQLVRSDASAVVFSANPVTGSRGEIVVNATIGLGESLVGGTVTPDSWRVDKERLTVIQACIGDKQRMTIATTDGTREVDVPRVLRLASSLNEAQVVELANLARGLEQVTGWAVDVEAAYFRGKLYLLQCRPITSGIDPIPHDREVQLDLAAKR